MDGGGRLDQPLMRSGPKATEEVGAPYDGQRRQLRALRFAWGIGYRRRIGRWNLRIPPPGVGIAGSVLLLAATLGYGAIAGGHVADVVNWLKDARD